MDFRKCKSFQTSVRLKLNMHFLSPTCALQILPTPSLILIPINTWWRLQALNLLITLVYPSINMITRTFTRLSRLAAYHLITYHHVGWKLQSGTALHFPDSTRFWTRVLYSANLWHSRYNRYSVLRGSHILHCHYNLQLLVLILTR